MQQKDIHTEKRVFAQAEPIRRQTRESTLSRILDLFDYLHGAQEPVSLAAIATGMNAPRSTTYKLVRALTEAGMLETSAETGRVFFGKRLYLYGNDYIRENDLLRRGRLEVDRLSQETGETAELCILQNGRYTIAHSRVGTRPFRISSAVGMQIPLPWTASGRLLLADMSHKDIASLIADKDLILPDGHVLTFEDFLADIDNARKNGYCTTSGLVDAFTRCLAAPIRGPSGHVDATLCLVVPVDTSEAMVEQLLALLTTRAHYLSASPSGA
jgi:DNA-binding IclR family transcriptional regulator